MARLLIYGAYGYTGRLVTERAVAAGIEPIIAGRDEGTVTAQARAHDLDARSFGLDSGAGVEPHLADVDAVLNCAGPFVDTYGPLVDACLSTGTDYLDVTGELPVVRALLDRDDRARDAGVALLPGVGFEVVAADCLGAHVVTALRDAGGTPSELEIAVDRLGAPSAGSLRTAVEHFGGTAVVRRDGRLGRVPLGDRTRTVDVGAESNPELTTPIPSASVVAAGHSTGVPDVTVSIVVSRRALATLRVARRVEWLLAADPVADGLRSAIDRLVDDPDDTEHADGRPRLWARAADDHRAATARLSTPNGYAFTARAAVACARRTLDGECPAGFRTPVTAFGPELVLEVDGVAREDATVGERTP